MKLTLRDIEPFNIPSVDDNLARDFLRHFSGTEVFEFTGDRIPLSMMLTNINLDNPNHIYANGFLLSSTIDDYERELSKKASQDYIIKDFIIGKIVLELSGELIFGSSVEKRINVQML